MSDADEYDVVTLTGGSDAVEAAPAAAEVVTDAAPTAIGGELEVNEPKRQRTPSAKVRAMFENIGKAIAANGGAAAFDELVPVDTTATDDAAPDIRTVAAPKMPGKPAAAAAPTAAVAPPVAAAAPVVPPAVEMPAAAADIAALAIESQRQAAADAREQALTAREADLDARIKALPTRDAYIDRPAATIRDLVKQWSGAETDADTKDAIADLISELTAETLGTQLDPTLRQSIETRKALRTVRTYKADQQKLSEAQKVEQAKRDNEAREAQEATAQKQREVAAQGIVQRELTAKAADFPFLMNNDDDAAPHLVVWSVLESQRDQFVKQYGAGALGQFKADWPSAAKLANDYYKTKADKAVKRYQPLLAPAAPVAAAAKPSPQVSAQVPRSTTQPATTQVDPTDEAPASEEKWDRHAQRRQSRELLRRAVSARVNADD